MNILHLHAVSGTKDRHKHLITISLITGDCFFGASEKACDPLRVGMNIQNDELVPSSGAVLKLSLH